MILKSWPRIVCETLAHASCNQVNFSEKSNNLYMAEFWIDILRLYEYNSIIVCYNKRDAWFHKNYDCNYHYWFFIDSWIMTSYSKSKECKPSQFDKSREHNYVAVNKWSRLITNLIQHINVHLNSLMSFILRLDRFFSSSCWTSFKLVTISNTCPSSNVLARLLSRSYGSRCWYFLHTFQSFKKMNY